MQKSTIARALELARSATCCTIKEIRQKLHTENYDDVNATVSGASIQTQLKALMKAAKPPA